MADQDELFHFNGVDASTGSYGLSPMSGAELCHFLLEERAPEWIAALRNESPSPAGVVRGLREGVDPKSLAEAGWGVIFTPNVDPAVQDALQPLLDMRREQAGDRFRVFTGADAYRPGESKTDFLTRHGVGPGPVDPVAMPYYLMIVGGPQTVPFRFQSQLAVQHAVGRIYFESVEEYASYARSVVEVETEKPRIDPRIALFATRNPDDPSTRYSSRHLVEPLRAHLDRHHTRWQVDSVLGEEATKANLGRLLGGARTPAVLFTASHGVELPAGDSRLQEHQGALLCQDWPGPSAWHGPLLEDHFFAGRDLADDTRLTGLMSFHFACYGAGTPPSRSSEPSPDAFLAALPTRMLSRPRGGALAVVGQAERAWAYSFLWPGTGGQTTVFESAFDRLLGGYPIGSAIAPFGERYAELSTVLADLLQHLELGAETDVAATAGLWAAHTDARSLTVLGDPAVRLPVAPADRDMLGASDPRRPTRALPLEATVSGETAPGAASYAVGSPDVEDVHFSAYHPRSVAIGTTHPMLVYAHLPGAIEAIATDVGQVLGMVAADYHQAGAEARTRIAEGTEIRLVPQARGIVFEPPEARLSWSGTWQRADFTLKATEEAGGGQDVGSRIACYVGPLLIAEIPLHLAIIQAGQAPETHSEREVQTCRMYQSVFASYSHADSAVVEAMEAACTALGMDYLRDVMKLKSGQSWSEELLHMIERADVFQLFWSEESSRSQFVEQEWRHALHLTPQKGPAFIRPVYWKRPLPPVPPPLYHIHFARIDVPEWTGPRPTAPQAATARQAATLTHPEPKYAPSAQDSKLDRLTISTFTGDPDHPDTARLRARTRVSLTGDVEVYVPEDAATEELLAVHETTVREALRARIAYLELLAGRKTE